MSIKTFDQLKSNYRICENHNKFYIQRKTKFGFWSNYTNSEEYFDNPIVIILLVISGLLTLVLLIGVIISKLHNLLWLLLILDVILISVLMFITHFTKLFCNKSHDLRYALNSVNDLVNSEIDELKIKEKKRNDRKNNVKKYHYFYSDSQLRKEKLKKLKK